MSLGMDVSRRYWQQIGRPSLEAAFPGLMDRIAVGLAGEGSDCFGCDDAISRDHDWGPGFCVWISRADDAQLGEALRAWYASLPQSFEGFAVKQTPERIGVLEREAFFARFLGRWPLEGTAWLLVQEHALAVCLNGEIFHDGDGVFTGMRAALASIPEPVRQKKLAARCVTMMQAGQYNLPRCIRRGELLAAAMAASEFA